jgi:hypothetical protein
MASTRKAADENVQRDSGGERGHAQRLAGPGQAARNEASDGGEGGERQAERGRPHGDRSWVRRQLRADVYRICDYLRQVELGSPLWSKTNPPGRGRRRSRGRERRGGALVCRGRSQLQADDPGHRGPAGHEDNAQPWPRLHEASDPHDRERGEGRKNERDERHPPRPRFSQEVARAERRHGGDEDRGTGRRSGIDEVDEDAERGDDQPELGGSAALVHSGMVRNRAQ